MEPQLVPDPTLAAELQELSRLEDLYHAACPQASLDAFDALVPPEFWETGATGRRYSRAFARQVLAQREGTPPAQAWVVDEHHLQRVAPDVYLLTYRLQQSGRATRRMSLWRRDGEHWQVVYHQGTVINI